MPTGSYANWMDLKRNVVLPAVNELNAHSEDSGFSVRYETIREGKAFTKIKFTLTKTKSRDNRDKILQGKAKKAISFTSLPHMTGDFYQPTEAVLDQIRTIAPGWDRQALLAQYRDWSRGKTTPQNPHGAFIGWIKRCVKNNANT